MVGLAARLATFLEAAPVHEARERYQRGDHVRLTFDGLVWYLSRQKRGFPPPDSVLEYRRRLGDLRKRGVIGTVIHATSQRAMTVGWEGQEYFPIHPKMIEKVPVGPALDVGTTEA